MSGPRRSLLNALVERVLVSDGAMGTMLHAAEPTMDVEAVARAVVYMASLPLEANVLCMTIMATHMPYVGRG